MRVHAARSRCTLSVNKRHLSPGIALHFAFYALRSLRSGLCFGLCFTPSVCGRARVCVCTCIRASVHNMEKRYSARFYSPLSSLSSSLITPPCHAALSPIFLLHSPDREDFTPPRRVNFLHVLRYLISYSLSELFPCLVGAARYVGVSVFSPRF